MTPREATLIANFFANERLNQQPEKTLSPIEFDQLVSRIVARFHRSKAAGQK